MWTLANVAWTGAVWTTCFAIHQGLSSIVKKLTLGKYSKRVSNVELVDLVHESVPTMQRLRHVPEHLTNLAPALLVAHAVLTQQWHIFPEFFAAHAFLLIARSTSFVGTLLPDVSKMCTISH